MTWRNQFGAAGEWPHLKDTKQCPRCMRMFRRWGQTKNRPSGRGWCRECERERKHLPRITPEAK